MKTIETDEAPAAVGTYSQGRVVGDRILTAGQIGLDPSSGKLVDGDFAHEVRRTLENVLAVVRAGGGTAGTVLKTTVYLTDLDYYETVNEVYASTLTKPYPPRAVLEVSGLPKDARVEIEAEATLATD